MQHIIVSYIRYTYVHFSKLSLYNFGTNDCYLYSIFMLIQFTYYDVHIIISNNYFKFVLHIHLAHSVIFKHYITHSCKILITSNKQMPLCYYKYLIRQPLYFHTSNSSPKPICSLVDSTSSSIQCFLAVEVSFHCGAVVLLLSLDPVGLPLFRLASLASLALFSSTYRHVLLLCPSAIPHNWHILFFFFSPLAPSFIIFSSVFFIVRPFGLARSGIPRFITSTLKFNLCIIQIRY
jgi:hypothetical protein